MLKLEALAAHIKSRGVADEYIAYNRAPLRPDRCITITEFSGGNNCLEGDLDTHYIQTQCRSAKNEPIEARDLAYELDRIFMDRAAFPADLGGYHAINCDRIGGPPVYMTTDDESRTYYICNYSLKIQR